MKTRDIVEVGDLRVGLLGVVMTDLTVYRDAPFGGAPTEPPNEVVVREAGKLLAEGCTCVVPITHQPIEDDRALARRLVPPAPAIVGGHEHTPFLEQVGSTWIVKAGSDATGAVITELLWEGGKLSVTARLEPTSGYAEDVELLERVNAHMAKVVEIQHAEPRHPGAWPDAVVGGSAPDADLARNAPLLVASAMRSGLTTASSTAEGFGALATTRSASPTRTSRPRCRSTTRSSSSACPVVSCVRRSSRRARTPPLNRERSCRPTTGSTPRSSRTTRDYRVAIVRNLLLGMDHIEPLVRFAASHPDRIPPPMSGRDVKHVLVDAFAVALWRKLGKFDEIDVDHDGVISEPEVAAALARVTAEAPSHVTAQLLVRALDRNADNVISRAELDATK